jgi:hypothetical protein
VRERERERQSEERDDSIWLVWFDNNLFSLFPIQIFENRKHGEQKKTSFPIESENRRRFLKPNRLIVVD